MANLFATADRVGELSGGGSVTLHEHDAFKSLDIETYLKGREQLGNRESPWGYDDELWAQLGGYSQGFPSLSGGAEALIPKSPWKLAHFYAGSFTKSIELLKTQKTKITYTAAAHDISISKREHEALGIPFNYPHLTEPELWKRYIGGYLAADVVICPSTHSAQCMRNFGCSHVVVIPHGTDLPAKVDPIPEQTFTVGYLGSFGVDKSVRYLLEAWKKLNYKDGSVLLLGGRDSTAGWTLQLIQQFGGGNIQLTGWLNNVSDFYNRLSVYVQPSASEGFGIEVLEAAAHARPVLCSKGAGAVDLILDDFRFDSCNSDVLAAKIDWLKKDRNALVGAGQINAQHAINYQWSVIRDRYISLWKELLGSPYPEKQK